MKRLTIAILSLGFVLSMPMLATAMSHGDHGSHGKQAAADMQDHKGHQMTSSDDDFTEIGKDTRDGVVATVKVKVYDEKTQADMAKMGMAVTHHVMVFFTDEKSGAEIVSGQAAIKVKGEPDKPVKLMQMEAGFGADVVLNKSAMYTFEIGTRLEDGKQRQFEIGYHKH